MSDRRNNCKEQDDRQRPQPAGKPQSEQAEADWVQTIIDASVASIAFLEACTPGYYNNEGQPNGELIRQNGAYAPGIMAFAKLLADWREEGSLAGLEFARD